MTARPEKLKALSGQSVRFRGPFEPLRVPLIVEGESMTDTSHGNDTDVNNIIARFDRTGQLPGNPGTGQYVDVSALNADLTELLEKQRSALKELEDLEEELLKNHEHTQEIQNDINPQDSDQDDPAPSE